MDNWDAIVKQARDCHTKQAWESLFAAHGALIATASQSRPVAEIFKSLRDDANADQYDPQIWGTLLKGCLTSWDLELGKEIAHFAVKTRSSSVAINVAQLYLENGQPVMAREIAGRALRLAGLTPRDALQLEMLTCSSYAEEGKHQTAIRLLNKMSSSIRTVDVEPRERADLLTRMARMQFFLGRYLHAGELFLQTKDIYLTLEDWEAAAKALFNTAACYQNAGSKRQELTFAMVEECRRLAEAHDLRGPLSHCEAFYGLDDYHTGEFAGAREHFRRALEYLPISDKSFRRLHILSMLAYTYLATGRYQLARKFGQQTLELAARDESNRFKTRYISLEAELLWEDGQIEKSHGLLEKAVAETLGRGVHTLEEMSTVSRYLTQLVMLGRTDLPKVEVEESLKKNILSYANYLYCFGLMHINRGEYLEAEKVFEECLTKARQQGSRALEAFSLQGLVESALAHSSDVEDIVPLLRDYEIAVAKLEETPLRVHVQFAQAGVAYRKGDIAECERILRATSKAPRISFPDRFVLSCWLSTLEGRSPRLLLPWQAPMLARYTRVFFAPTIKEVDKTHFEISGCYSVNLERHQALAELLHHLLAQSNFSATAEDIQTQVWRQSLEQLGWQQKIRNTIMRLRGFLPFTMAPLILHGETIRLFVEAISVRSHLSPGLRPEDEILRMVLRAPMSSSQLSQRLGISAATAKRILKRLTDDNKLKVIKQGRNISYLAVT